MSETTPLVAELSEVSELELKFFTSRLRVVEKVLANLELVKLYGRGKVLDLGKADSKSTKSNTAPDPVDLHAIDLDIEIRAALFALCREYEESVMVNVLDLKGVVTGQAPLPPVESSDPDVMVEYLSDPHSLEWVRYTRWFDESACEIIELIDKAIKYTTEIRVEKPREVVGLETIIERMLRDNSIENYPRTPIQIVRMVNSFGYPLKLKDVTNWIQRGQIEQVSVIGKTKAYLPTDVMKRYLLAMRKAAKKSFDITFVNKVA